MKSMLKFEQKSRSLNYIKPKWYLVQTKPGAHFAALKNLEKQGFEIFLPLVQKTAKKRGKFVEKTVPLFSNYLFLGTKLNEVSWKSINATRGVSKIITMDGKFRAVQSKIIEALKSRCDPQGFLRTQCEIATGDTVRIEKGSFVDFVCKVEAISDSQRVWVLMEMMQQKTRTKIPLGYLSKVS